MIDMFLSQSDCQKGGFVWEMLRESWRDKRGEMIESYREERRDI